MKIITLNLKAQYKKGRAFLKLIAVILLVVLAAKITVSVYASSDVYTETLSEITEKSTVIIDAGHGGEDCGAIGVNGVYEKDLNFSIANTLGDMLSKNGYAVVYTRTSDALLYTESENIYGIRKISDLKNRCKLGAEYSNAIYISIHMNSYKSPECDGLQVYYSNENDSTRRLGLEVQNAVKAKLQPKNNRKIKNGDGIYLLENLKNPAILIECGFLTNPIECENLIKKEYQKELCSAIFYGIIEYIAKETNR